MTRPTSVSSLAQLSKLLDERRLAHANALRAEAPHFTPFAYLRSDEFGISKIIAALLDPNGRHSQGTLFLSLFMEAFGLTSFGSPGGQIQVTTEDPTAAGRRIDIVIQDKDWIITLENKPWARDSELQVADYLGEIRRRGCPQVCLIYLTSDARAPSEASISNHECDAALACGELRLASYAQVIDWLGVCHERCLAASVRNFLSNFQDHLREVVMKKRKLEMDNPVVDGVLAQEARPFLRTALAIAQQKDAIRSSLLAKLHESLRQRLAGWSVTGTPMLADHGMEVAPPGSEWSFCVELDSSTGRWFYGLKLPKANGLSSKAMSRLGNRLVSRYRGSEGPNDHWLIWLWFTDRSVHDPSTYAQWENEIQPWIDMVDGTMAENLAALATELNDVALDLKGR